MLRFGFIGLGAMGQSHVNSIAELCPETVEIAAICARSEQHLQQTLKVAPKARVFKSEAALIAAPLDAIFISTPNFTHVPLALQVLQARKHLYLEKPCGISREECRQLQAAADATDRVTMIGHELRHSPFFQKMKDLVVAGAIGEPQMVWCREFRGPFQRKTNDWIQDNRRSGGTLVEKNCHHFDLMNWWVNAPPKRVCAFGGNAVHRVLDGPEQGHDHAAVIFEYANKVRGSLQLCLFALDFPQEDLEMGIIGDSGRLQTRLSAMEIHHWTRGARPAEPTVHSVPTPTGHGWGGHPGAAEIHREFVNCIIDRRQPLTSVSACLDATLLGIAAEESIRLGQMVEV